MIVLHIGAPKTGSTSIQDFLHVSRQDLADAGLVIPDVGWSKGRGHAGVRLSMNKNMDGKPEAEDIRRELKAVIASEKKPILITSEMLWTVSPKSIFRVYPELRDAKVVCYIREQTDMIASHYSQKVKGGDEARSISDFLNENWDQYDYQKALAKWLEAFGPGNVFPYVYEDASSNSGLVSHFLMSVAKIAGVDAAAIRAIVKQYEDQTKKYINRRATPTMVAMMLFLNRSDINIDDKKRLKQMILKDKETFAGFGSDGNLMSESMAEHIRQYYAESNEAVSQDWFGGGSLFE